MKKTNLTDKNIEYWDELCGTHLAKSLGINDSSIESLKKFDDYYFDLYRYLFDYIPFDNLKDKCVLEVGLGYGTVAGRLVESGAIYTGLDIARGPVDMVKHRLDKSGIPGQVIQGSILNPPFEEESFDTIVAIGCLHHTGDLQLAIDKCRNLLRPGGELIFMVYYAYSYRRFIQAPKTTISCLIKERLSYRGVVGKSKTSERGSYDTNAKLEVAPHTDWISKLSLQNLCKNFSSFSSSIENIDQDFPFKNASRIELLKTRWPSMVGLDLYAIAKK
jgi:SAM-dependent methyltransferase